jgi:hypothetical protein
VAETITGLTGTITGGSIGSSGSSSICDGALERQTINRMLGSGTDTMEMFRQQILRANADDQSLAIAARRKFELDISTQSSALDILQQRSTGAQPQSGGGPGQPVIFPVQQQLPMTQSPPPKVIAVSSTGQITTV